MENSIQKVKGNYRKSEKFYKHLEEIKELYSIKGFNENYWINFEANSNKTKSSLIQYKSAIKMFIDAIDKDVLLINIDDLETYLSNFDGITKDNQSRYIKSFITFSIENNVNKALKYTDKNLMLSLIPNEYKMLIQVLMDKQ